MATAKRRSTPDDPETLAAVCASIRSMTDEDWNRVLTHKPEGAEDPWADDVPTSPVQDPA